VCGGGPMLMLVAQLEGERADGSCGGDGEVRVCLSAVCEVRPPSSDNSKPAASSQSDTSSESASDGQAPSAATALPTPFASALVVACWDLSPRRFLFTLCCSRV
jgi:hypothetical protein